MMKRFLFSAACMAVAAAAFGQTKPDALREYRAGNYQQAIQICQDELTAVPNNMDSLVVISWSLIKLERYDEALKYAQIGRSLSRYDARITEILGEIAYSQGRNNEALQYFQEYVSLNPDGQRIELVYYYMGEVYIRQGKFRYADIALSTAVHWMPGNAVWWTRLAYARENAGDLPEAITAYERALTLNSQLSDAQRGLERVKQSLPGQSSGG